MQDNLRIFNVLDFLTPDTEDIVGEEMLKHSFSDFSCAKNIDVERFLKKSSIEFTKKHQSVTYLVFSEDEKTLLGYFSLAIKPITVRADRLSKTALRKIARVSEFDERTKTYTLSAYLIAQLGKNDSPKCKQLLTRGRLLDAAISTVLMAQQMVGGMVVFLEAEENEKLLQYYEKENGFRAFDTRESGKHKSLIKLLKVL